MTRNARFTKGVFNCTSCGRRTRGDDDSASLDMCWQCYELAGCDNQHNDDGTEPNEKEMAQYNDWLQQIKKAGGNDVRNDYPYIWRT